MVIMAVELLLKMPLRATANILAARSVYLMTSTPDGEAHKLWWKEKCWEVMAQQDINRSLDIID